MLRSNRQFRISHLFAPDEFSGALLALHALFASIDQLSTEVSEDLVARKKLDWWRLELSPDHIGRSRHPVIRHLGETGATTSLPSSALESLLDTAERRLDAQSPSNIKEFNQLCFLIYHPRMVLECALCGLDTAFVDDYKAVACEGGLLQLLRESFVKANPGYWWVPLNTLARFEVTRRDLQENSDAPDGWAVFQHILEGSREQLESEERGDPVKLDVLPGLLHLRLTALLQRRQLHHLQSIKPSRYGAELNRWHISDLMATWKLARQSKNNTA